MTTQGRPAPIPLMGARIVPFVVVVVDIATPRAAVSRCSKGNSMRSVSRLLRGGRGPGSAEIPQRRGHPLLRLKTSVVSNRFARLWQVFQIFCKRGPERSAGFDGAGGGRTGLPGEGRRRKLRMCGDLPRFRLTAPPQSQAQTRAPPVWHGRGSCRIGRWYAQRPR
jgi:hypothetical protein